MDPEQLLAQIRAMLDQYLSLGEDTPVAAEAQALASAIDGATGMGTDPMGAEPPAGDPGLLLGGEGAPSEPEPALPEEGYDGGSFDEATAGAKEFLKKKRPRAA